MINNLKREKGTSKTPPTGGMFFILTYIGAAVHFVDKAEGFDGVVLALLKALVWPAFLINRVFELLRI